MTARVLVVDDSPVYRITLTRILAQMPDIEVVGSAADGRLALHKIETQKPDIITLDIEMPEMNGLELLTALRQRGLAPLVLIVSAHTQRDGELGAKALALGAFDVVLKPDLGSALANEQYLTTVLGSKLAEVQQAGLVRRRVATGEALPPPAPTRNPRAWRAATADRGRAGVERPPPELVLIAISTGGPRALHEVLPALTLSVPVVIAQHMPAHFTGPLAESLARSCNRTVKEAESGELLLPGVTYIAPGGMQTRIAAGGTFRRRCVAITSEPAPGGLAPCADLLFESAAHHIGRRVLAVVMTGMGCDGTAGARMLRDRGAEIIAQDEATSTVWGMPKSVVDAGLASDVLSLERLAPYVRHAVDASRDKP